MKYKLPRHIIYVVFFLLFFIKGNAQYASEHYIAPSPWQYWSDANEIVLTTESTTTVTVTLSKSDGTFLTTRTLTSSSPDVYRFAGQPWNNPKNPVNSVLTNAGLIVTATGGKVSVNLRNVASDQASSSGGDTDGNTIKGNASLVSFGNEGRGTEFRLGYYRSNFSSGTFGSFPGVSSRPVYSVMAIEDNTQVTLNGSNLILLNKGESYLFQPTTVGDLLQANKPVVANTGAYTDTPGGCGDGAVDQIAPVAILGTKHIVIRGSGTATTTDTRLPEQTIFIASKNNTTITVRNYNNSGVLISTNNYTLTNAGNYQSIFHGDGANAYSSSIIESNEPIIVYSGTAQGCEVDIATVLPVGGCSGSKWTSTSRFVRYDQTAPNAALPYFGFVLIESATTPILVNGTNIETTTGTPRFQIGNSGFYLTKFDNNQIGNPNNITVTSTARMNVGIVQQGGGFSMSGFFSSFNETPSLPDITYDSNGCAIDVITADAGLEPYQWYYEGSLLPGETSQSIVPTLTGNYSITGTRDCGITGQSAVVYVEVCGDLGVTKTVANGPLPNQVEFTITATNAGPNDDKNVVVTDVLPVGYTYVSSNPSTGTYSNTTGKWNIGNFANGGSATLTILATINASGAVNNTASIKGSNLDLNTVNNSSTTVPTGALRLLKTAQSGIYNSIGDIITYDLELINTGRIPIYTITITDDNADVGSISPASVTNLAPGASVSITAEHTVTVVDLLAGKVINSAKASGFDGSNNPISDISGTNPLDPSDDTSTETITVSIIDADDDTVGNVNGYISNLNVINIFNNDDLNGASFTATEVDITIGGTGVPSELVLNSNGNVDVVAGTAAGTYTFDYTICEKAVNTNCSTATVTVTVIPSVIDAVNDTVSNVNGYAGATNVVNVLTNDTLNGVAVIPAEVTLTQGSGDTAELTINTDGSVDVTPGTPAGTYTLDYTICEVLNPANCETATVTVTVIPAVIDAVNDTASNINGYTGATNVVNVLTNDTLNGVAVIPAEVTLTQGSGDTDELTINTDGSVDVTPGTPAGTYTLDYTICEVLNPANCNDATVSVTVVPAPIDAVNDTASNINGYTGATNVVNVLTNDTLNGVAVIPGEVTLTQGSGDTDELTINTDGSVDVTPGTPAGTYTLDYTICEVLNPANCESATVTVTVIPAVIDAVNDTASNVNGPTGETDVVNVLINDTLNGIPVTPSEVTITTVTGNPQLILDPVDGSVNVIPNTPGGTYELTYQICEVLNPTNCITATVTVFVMEPKFTLTKDAQVGIFDSIGDVITYDLVLTNTGNVALENITITDENADTINPATMAVIAPGEIVNIVATHTITQSDLNSGFVHNTAFVTGTDPKDGLVTDISSDPTDPLQPGDSGYDPACAECTVNTVTQLPSLVLTKDARAGDYDSVGDIITYDLILTNTGNVTITDLIVSDANANSVTPSTVAILLPGASVNITATHSITQADLDTGFVYNTAQVSGSDSLGNSITDESSDPTDPAQPGDAGYNPACPDCTISQVNQNNAMQLLKEADYQDANGDGKVNPGDTIFYSFTVENTGNTTLTDIIVQDPLVAVNGGSIATLAPGGTDTSTFTALYTITQDDMEKGAVYNLALADGLAPKGDAVNTESKDPTPINENDPLFDASCPDCTVISLTQTPSMALVKMAVLNDDNNDGSAQVGETISYSFKVINTGTVDLHNVIVTDALPGVILSGGPVTLLEVGQEDSTTYTAIYTITQADINAGVVTNQAGAQAETATGSKLAVTSDDNDVVGNDPTITELNGCAIEIFNAISADDNGDNDEFYIGGIECYPDNEVRIFNRWGVLVYDVKGYDNNEKAFRGYSDGRVTVSDSSSLPAGTYFYVIQYKKADGSTHKKDGYLYITR